MSRALSWLIDTSGFVPRWACGDWSGGLGWLHITADLAIWLAYLAIPLVLVFLVRRRRDVPFSLLFWLFGLFIVSCGTTHLLDAVIFYDPVYRLSGVVKVVTALASWGTVFALAGTVPHILAARGPQELAAQVAARTAELAAANAALRQEIEERGRAEVARRESEERFHRTFDGMLEGCQIIGFDWRYLYVNDSLAAHARRTKGEMLGRTLMEVYPGIERTEVFAILRRCMEERTSHRFENRFEYPEGGEGWFDLSAQPGPEGIFVLSADITDRKRAEDALRQKEEQLRAADRRLAGLVEGMSEGCFVLDAGWRFTFVNDRAEALLRCRRDGVIGRVLWEVFPRASDPPVEGHYRRAMAERVPVTFVVFSATAGRWLDVRLFPAGDGLAAFLLDVHDRKLAEEALRVSEERFRGAFEHTSVAMALTDMGDRFVRVNGAFARLFGYTPEELRGLGMGDIVHPDHMSVSYAHREALVQGASNHFETERRYVHRDGHEIWGRTNVALVRDPAGRPHHYVGQIQDVTAHKRAERALRESEELFRQLAESIPQLAWMTGPDGSVSWYNQRWYEYTGAALEEVKGWGWLGLTDPAERPRVEERFKRHLASGEPWEDTFPLRRRDGAMRWHLSRAMPFRDAAGGVQRWFGTNTDVTEQRELTRDLDRARAELERRVAERTAQLEEANKELEAFTYSVSHDLRAPLRAVDGFARILDEEYGPALPPAARDHLRDVCAGARQMGRLVDDLLAFARLGRKSVARHPVGTAALVRACLGELRPGAAGRAVDVRVADLPDCWGDPALLKQVWLNLLGNALKYTGKRAAAVVEVGAEPGPDGPVYFVRDNGVGFDMRYAHKLFGVFQRLHRAEEYEGTGVGLAVVQRIVHRHGGRVWAEAQPERGATFFFTVPADPGPAPDGPAPLSGAIRG